MIVYDKKVAFKYELRREHVRNKFINSLLSLWCENLRCLRLLWKINIFIQVKNGILIHWENDLKLSDSFPTSRLEETLPIFVNLI